MSIDEPTEGRAHGAHACPWCSAPISTADERCPSCGANLREADEPVETAPEPDEPEIPGVTQVDPALLERRSRGQPGLIGWRSGDGDAAPPQPAASSIAATGDTDSLAPPSPEVKREMRRLELEALRAQAEAETPEIAPDDGTRVPRTAEASSADAGDASETLGARPSDTATAGDEGEARV